MAFWQDAGNAVASVASNTGNAIENGGNAVVDTVEDGLGSVGDGAEAAARAIADGAGAQGHPVLAAAGAVVGGVILGFVEGLRDMGHAVMNMVRDVLGIAGGVLRGDFGYAFNKLVDLVIDFILLHVALTRFLLFGTLVGGIVKYAKRNRLRAFVETLLRDRFGSDPGNLARIRGNLALDRWRWGLRLPATHRVFMIDSANLDKDTTPLWTLHQNGAIDLYALAGLWSSDQPANSFRVRPHDSPTTACFIVNEDGSDGRRADRYFLSHHINDDDHPGRFRIYAMDRRSVAERIRVATDKHEDLGVRLQWNDGERFSWFRGYANFEITNPAEIRAPRGRHRAGNYLITRGLRTTDPAQDRTPLALGVFRFTPSAEGNEIFGICAGRHIREFDQALPCQNRGRTDDACSEIARLVSSNPSADPVVLDLPGGSAAYYRDFWPSGISRYILAHELGHYMGLAHPGHDGFNNIMFSLAAGSKPLSGGVFAYLMRSEPSFTLKDAMNSWRFITDQMRHVL